MDMGNKHTKFEQTCLFFLQNWYIDGGKWGKDYM